MATSDAERDVSMMETVNIVIDNLHRSLGLADSDFFCECGHLGCKEPIRLTQAEYACLRAGDRHVTVVAPKLDKHSLSF